jgi:hypothetical protein
VNNKGVYLLIEAILSLTLLVSILVLLTPLEKNNLNKLLVLQKANDLIKVWVKEKSFHEEKMAKDFESVFPRLKGEITLKGKKIVIKGRDSKNIVSVKGFYVIKGVGLREIRLKVFY